MKNNQLLKQLMDGIKLDNPNPASASFLTNFLSNQIARSKTENSHEKMMGKVERYNVDFVNLARPSPEMLN